MKAFLADLGECSGCYALRARVAALEALIAADRVGTDADLATLRAIAEAADGKSFTASQLWRRARVDAPLRAAFGNANVADSRALGRWLRRRRNVSVAGLRVTRLERRASAGRRWLVVMTPDDRVAAHG